MYFVIILVYFCLGGNAIGWYFKEQDEEYRNGSIYPLGLLLSKHLGSVIACSFMTGFFTLFDLVFDMVRPVSTENCYAGCFKVACGWIHYLGDLVRSDGLTLVGLTGDSYWIAARYSEYVTGKAPLTEYYQFSSRIFSLAAHFFIVSLSIIYAVYFPKISSIDALLLVIVLSLAISTFFVSFH
jgi:hypothetical protein